MTESTPRPPATPPQHPLPPLAPLLPYPLAEVPVPSVPPKKHRTHAIIIGSAAAVIAAIVTTGIVVVGVTKGSAHDDDKPAAAVASSIPDEDVATSVSEPTYVGADADSFSIDLRVTARQCFGSAGCNVTVEPELTYLGSSGDLDPDAVYEITYEIHGDESGPVIQTAELTNQTSLSYRPSLISTASASTEPSVEITDVQEG
ncbi:hypothetical protein OIE43_29970 [Streptomyces pseudovenezuelae]|uniref:hypothetical protein n=1 Tax=Streptomyces pseudovenezuelae TaxID=67350 RepID=UPI002E3119AC|nr:hypothetical protein [Streptomyces pseudovenezuelae]